MRNLNVRERSICAELLGGNISHAILMDKNLVHCKTSATGRKRERGDLIGPGWFWVDTKRRTISRTKPGATAPEQLQERLQWIKTASLDALSQCNDDMRKTVIDAVIKRRNQLETIAQKEREAAERRARAIARTQARAGLVKGGNDGEQEQQAA